LNGKNVGTRRTRMRAEGSAVDRDRLGAITEFLLFVDRL
jgi:hypothetical protein